GTTNTGNGDDSPIARLLGTEGVKIPPGTGGGNAIGPGLAAPWKNRTATNRSDLVFQYGGSLQTEKAVQDALDWLARHQNPAGFLDNDRFFDACPQGDLCSGPAVETGSDTGLTGLSLLAFL